MIERRLTSLTALTPLLAFVGLGLPAGAIGVAWPYMRTSLQAPLSGLGIVIAAWTAAYFAVSSATGALNRRFRAPLLLVVSSGVAGAGMLGFAAAPNLPLLAAASLLAGAGSGLIDATVNAEISLTRGVRFMGWLHASWAVGAAIGPLMVVASLKASGAWQPAFVAMAILFAAVGVLIGRQRSGASGIGAQAQPEMAANPVRQEHRLILILLVAVFLFGSGIEGTAGDWSYSNLTGGRLLPAGTAGFAVSLFWIGLAAGRMGLGLLGHRVRATRLLDVCLSLVVVAALAFWLAPPVISAFAALPLLGLAISVIFPLLLSLTPARVGMAMTAHAVGYQLAAGTLGAGGFPAIAGLLLQLFGLPAFGPILTLLAIALLVLHILSRDATRT